MAATAVVAAVTGILGVVVSEGILDLELLPPRWNVLGLDGHVARYAASAATAALVAGALLYVLVLTAPNPETFFIWITALLIAVASVLPFAVTDDTADALVTGLLNALIGISLISLLPAVAVRTRR